MFVSVLGGDDVVEFIMHVVDDIWIAAFVHGHCARGVFGCDVAHAVFDPHSCVDLVGEVDGVSALFGLYRERVRCHTL